MLYLPPEALLHDAAAAANEPDGSGNTYQFNVTGPLPLEDPQPAMMAAVNTAPRIMPLRAKRTRDVLNNRLLLPPTGREHLIPGTGEGASKRIEVRTTGLSPGTQRALVPVKRAAHGLEAPLGVVPLRIDVPADDQGRNGA